MNAPQHHFSQSAIEIAQKLAKTFAETAAERDKQGGNPKAERDLIRQSGLLCHQKFRVGKTVLYLQIYHKMLRRKKQQT